jgi:tetratricopeptide (TPR) repeat protein
MGLLLGQQYPDAEKAFSKVVEMDPRRDGVRALLITSLLPQRRFSDAEKLANDFSDATDTSEKLMMRSDLNIAQGRILEGFELRRQALKLNPDFFSHLAELFGDPENFQPVLQFLRQLHVDIGSDVTKRQAEILDAIETPEQFKEYMKIQGRIFTIDLAKPGEMVSALESLLSVLPNSAELLMLVAETKATIDTDKALEYANRALSLDPTKALRANLLFGRISFQKGKFREALGFYEKALEIDSNSIDAKKSVVVALQLLRNKDQAFERLTRYVNEHPKDATLRSLLGESLTREQKMDEARAQFRIALELDPEIFDKQVTAMAKVPPWQLKLYMRSILPREQYSLLSKLDAATLGEFQSKFIKALVLGDLAAVDPKIWLKVAEGIAKGGSKDPENLANLGNIYFMAEKYDSAIDALRRAIELSPKQAENHSDLGDALAANKQYAEAEESYRRAIELDPKYAVTYADLADVYMKMNRADDAVQLLLKSAEIKPRARPYIDLGDIYRSQEKSEEVLGAYKKAAELEPQNVDVLEKVAYFFAASKSYADALEWYTRIIALTPKDARAYRNRADEYIALGQLENAEKDLEIASELDPDAAFLQIRYADLLIHKGDFERAEERARKAVERTNESPAKFILGLSQLAQGKYLDSIDTYRSAVSGTDRDQIEWAKHDLDKIIKDKGQITGADIISGILQNALQDSQKQ